jgi:hypothetical protein
MHAAPSPQKSGAELPLQIAVQKYASSCGVAGSLPIAEQMFASELPVQSCSCVQNLPTPSELPTSPGWPHAE